MGVRFTVVAVVLAAVAWLGGGSGARADLIVNGDFETGDFTGWTLSGNTSDPTTFGVDSNFPHSGNFAAFFGPVGSLGFLSQTVATTPGATYTLDFFVMNEDGTSPNEFSAAVGSTVVMDAVNVPTFDYQEFRFNVTATAAATVVQFGFRNDFSFFDIDDVKLQPVPEPGSLVCLAIGVVLLGGYGWKDRSRRLTV
jgi:hypothetical protein